MTRQCIQGQQLTLGRVDDIQSMDEVIADDLPDLLKDGLLGVMPIDDMGNSIPLQFCFVAPDNNTPDPCQVQELRGEFPTT